MTLAHNLDEPRKPHTLNRRQHRRYSIAFPVTLRIGSQRLALTTANVSIGGLFIEGPVRTRPRELLRLEMFLPPRYPDFLVHGMAVHGVDEDDPSGRIPGIGIQLYALDHALRDLWADFIRHVSTWKGQPALITT